MQPWLHFSQQEFATKPTYLSLTPSTLDLFGSVVVVAFQIAFHIKIHANDFFYFLKIIFDISTSK
jgi:hypothetical protein